MGHEQPVLGIDIGGSSVKFCLLEAEEIVAQASKEYTDGKHPTSVLRLITEQMAEWNYSGTIGIGFPGMIENNIILDAPNLGQEWNGYNFPTELGNIVKEQIHIINDADAAALAMSKQTEGWDSEHILCLTLGTGIGSAWLRKGELETGTEYGRLVHPQFNCSLEQWASVATMNRSALSMEEWALRLCSVLTFLETKFNPDRFLLSGGITVASSEWLDILLQGIQTPVDISRFGHLTGAVGAAKLHSV